MANAIVVPVPHVDVAVFVKVKTAVVEVAVNVTDSFVPLTTVGIVVDPAPDVAVIVGTWPVTVGVKDQVYTHPTVRPLSVTFPVCVPLPHTAEVIS